MEIPDDTVQEGEGEEAEPGDQNHTQVFIETEKIVTVNAEKRSLPDTFKEPGNKKNPKKKHLDPVQERMDEAYEILKTVAGTEKLKENQCSLYGKLVAEKLEGFDEFTRVILMHDIDNILFEAKMKQLRQESHKMIPPLQQSHVHPMSQSALILQMNSSRKSCDFPPSPQQISATHTPIVPHPQQSPVHPISQSASFLQMASSTKPYDIPSSSQQIFSHSHMVPSPQQSSILSMPQSPSTTYSLCSPPSPHPKHLHECDNYDSVNFDDNIIHL